MELLKYDSNGCSALKLGYNDVNHDGIDDTLLTLWNGKRVAFIGDDGILPWSKAEEGRDWNAYFNEAFLMWGANLRLRGMKCGIIGEIIPSWWTKMIAAGLIARAISTIKLST